jgi:hypothetical protein
MALFSMRFLLHIRKSSKGTCIMTVGTLLAYFSASQTSGGAIVYSC